MAGVEREAVVELAVAQTPKEEEAVKVAAEVASLAWRAASACSSWLCHRTCVLAGGHGFP